MQPNMKIIFSEQLNKINEIFKIDIKNQLNSHTPNKPRTLTGNQFFHFELDGDNVIIASFMGNGEIRVYAEYRSDYVPNKIMIGILSDDVVVQDTTINWSMKSRSILEHECWPECLAALNNAAIVASVMLS